MSQIRDWLDPAREQENDLPHPRGAMAPWGCFISVLGCSLWGESQAEGRRLNYLAHGFRFVDDPYFVAGTALPDWMNVIDRKNRARSHRAEPHSQAEDARVAAFARGVMQHHHDDGWFHQTEVFSRMSTQFAVELRGLLPEGHQAGFLGHIAVELLLDAALIAEAPERLDSYYNALRQLDPAVVEAAANQILPRPIQQLVILVPRFISERFIADYVDDQRLWRRLNHVMRRVGLQPLPESIIDWLSDARSRVAESSAALMTAEGDDAHAQATH